MGSGYNLLERESIGETGSREGVRGDGVDMFGSSLTRCANWFPFISLSGW